MLRIIALSAPDEIKPVDFKASRGWLLRFLKRMKISRRRCTHKVQTYVESLIPEIYAYLDILQKLQKTLPEDGPIYINFDEVPFFFDPSIDYTYNQKGEKSIEILSHKNKKTRVTVMPCICSNGHSLPPLFVFVYKYSGKSQRTFPIKYENLKNLTRPYMVRFNESGFTNENIILEYIQKVIIPYQQRMKKEVRLIFDQAPSHMTSKVKDYLDSKRIYYLHIPTGTTHLFQPLDVVINKPLKDNVRRFYNTWI